MVVPENQCRFIPIYSLAVLMGMCFFMGCEKELKLPISSDKLTTVLRDVHIAEAAVLHLKASEKDSILSVYYRQICEIHGIKRMDLDSSLAILKREPDMAFEQYEKVFEEMEKLNLKKE